MSPSPTTCSRPASRSCRARPRRPTGRPGRGCRRPARSGGQDRPGDARPPDEVGRLLALHEVEGRLRVGLLEAQQRAARRAAPAARPASRPPTQKNGMPQKTRSSAEYALGGRSGPRLADERTVGVQHPLRLAGRARGVDGEGEVGRRDLGSIGVEELVGDVAVPPRLWRRPPALGGRSTGVAQADVGAAVDPDVAQEGRVRRRSRPATVRSARSSGSASLEEVERGRRRTAAGATSSRATSAWRSVLRSSAGL